MAYKKWVGNQDRHNDWTTELKIDEDTVIRMGEPVQINAELVKKLEGEGRIFEDSSAEEAKERQSDPAVTQPPGGDVLGTAPVFQNAGEHNQTDQPSGRDKK